MGSESLWRAVAGIALSVGTGVALAPGRFARLYGLPTRAMTGTAAFGWRLFAVRTLVIGGAALAGSPAARAAFVPVQILDQLVFLHALATRSVPRRAALLAMGTSGAIVALSLAAQAAPDDAPDGPGEA